MASKSKRLPAGYWIILAALGLIALSLIGKTADRDSQIYVALYQAGYWASDEANKSYPFAMLLDHADDPGWAKRFLAKREEFYLERKKTGRAIVAETFKITPAEGDQIQERGDSGKWKVFDSPRLFFSDGIPPSKVPRL